MGQRVIREKPVNYKTNKVVIPIPYNLFQEIDNIFERCGNYKELDMELLMLWASNGLIYGHMICGIGGSLEG